MEIDFEALAARVRDDGEECPHRHLDPGITWGWESGSDGGLPIIREDEDGDQYGTVEEYQLCVDCRKLVLTGTRKEYHFERYGIQV